MKNRASSHLIALFIIIGFEIAGYYAIHRAGLIRGYETSWVSGVRDLLLYVPIIFLVLWLTRVMRFVGNWTLFTTAILLFSVGMLVQYRLYSDPEYNAPRGKKEAAREEKTGTMRERFIEETYTADKKQMMGLPATPPHPMVIDEANVRKANYAVSDALTAGTTWIPLASFFLFAISYWLCTKDRVLLWIQRHSFLIVLVTLIPLAAAVVTSQAGKVENMTPWEPSKIPFLLGFAGILTARYKDLARTYWGLPRAQDVVPLVVMAVIPFLPFFVLKDFGQMFVFSGAYATLYLVAVRRWPQLLLFVGSVALVAGILVVGALPRDVQEKVPLLPALARPVKTVLPDRIQQRFHLWLDGFTPPSPDTPWWKDKYDKALAREREKWDKSGQREIMQKSFDPEKFNRDTWFDDLAFQPSQAIFGIASGGTTGRGIGLGFSELIPIADSDYIYAAIGEELGLAGGAIVMLALIVFVCAGFRTSIDSRDMFTKLSSAGLTAFIGFQALVNIGGITRALPMTGITLPFVSHGGFSLMTSFAMLGMLMAFSHMNSRDAVVAAKTVREQVRRDPSIPEAVQ